MAPFDNPPGYLITLNPKTMEKRPAISSFKTQKVPRAIDTFLRAHKKRASLSRHVRGIESALAAEVPKNEELMEFMVSNRFSSVDDKGRLVAMRRGDKSSTRSRALSTLIDHDAVLARAFRGLRREGALIPAGSEAARPDAVQGGPKSGIGIQKEELIRIIDQVFSSGGQPAAGAGKAASGWRKGLPKMQKAVTKKPSGSVFDLGDSAHHERHVGEDALSGPDTGKKEGKPRGLFRRRILPQAT